jgi:hypothetical protein
MMAVNNDMNVSDGGGVRSIGAKHHPIFSGGFVHQIAPSPPRLIRQFLALRTCVAIMVRLLLWK